MAAKFCPLLKERVTYLFCEDCEEQICRGEKKREDIQEKKEGRDGGQKRKRQLDEEKKCEKQRRKNLTYSV